MCCCTMARITEGGSHLSGRLVLRADAPRTRMDPRKTRPRRETPVSGRRTGEVPDAHRATDVLRLTARRFPPRRVPPCTPWAAGSRTRAARRPASRAPGARISRACVGRLRTTPSWWWCRDTKRGTHGCVGVPVQSAKLTLVVGHALDAQAQDAELVQHGRDARWDHAQVLAHELTVHVISAGSVRLAFFPPERICLASVEVVVVEPR